MQHPIRRWLTALCALFAVAATAFALVHNAARRSLLGFVNARERCDARDRCGARGRPALLTPAEAGDAGEFYLAAFEEQREALSTEATDAPDAPGATEALARRAIEAAHQPMTVAAAWAIDPKVGHDGSRVPGFASLARRLVGASVHTPALVDATARLRWAAAALVVACDGLAFGRIERAAECDAAASLALDAVRDTLSDGVPSTAALEELARLLDALASRPLPPRQVDWAFAVAEAQAAGGSSAPGTWETPRGEHPGLRWLWSEWIARKAAALRIREEAAETARAWSGPPERLLAAIAAARARWASIDNPYLRLVLLVEDETIFWAPEPIVRPADLLETRRAALERMALTRAAVAVARFAAERRSLPRTLDDLVPRYAASVPIDPTIAGPLHQQDGLLWAVGPDGDDDDGRPAQHHADADEIPDGDAVWRIASPR